jgi:hypothetical protein
VRIDVVDNLHLALHFSNRVHTPCARAAAANAARRPVQLNLFGLGRRALVCNLARLHLLLCLKLGFWSRCNANPTWAC